MGGTPSREKIPMRELVDQALDHALDMCKGPEERLAFLNALDTKVRKDGADDWMAAIAIWRLQHQLEVR